MSDTHEEQLLSDLLKSIARDDAGLDAAHLEARVTDAWSAGDTDRLSAAARWMPASVGETRRHGGGGKADPAHVYLAIAAAVVIAAMVPGIARMMRDVQTPTVNPNVADAAPAAAPPALRRGTPTNPAVAPPAPQRGTPTRPSSESAALRRGTPTRPPSAEEFVPLMPMSEQELRGPFQLVRVQMPRASLGALRSPLDHPNELVEADVLLGEDGMARAIRVSTGASAYPWRSR